MSKQRNFTDVSHDQIYDNDLEAAGGPIPKSGGRQAASNLFKSQAKSLRKQITSKIKMMDGATIDLPIQANRQSLQKAGSTLQELPSLHLNISNGQV